MIYGIDFGAGSALSIYSDNGILHRKDLKLPRVPGGKTPAMDFPMVLEALMAGEAPGDIVFESPTIGSSGCEVEDILALLTRTNQKIYTISARAVKNFRMDHPDYTWEKGARYAKDGVPLPYHIELKTQADVHDRDAQIIHKIATQYPERLYHWTGPSEELTRKHTSVRPMDKHRYQGGRADFFMSLLPPFRDLPEDLQGIFEGTKAGEYSRPMVMPFAMSMDEPYIDAGPPEERRRRYEKIIGLYDRGYPSFYRRKTVEVMHHIAKTLTGAAKIEEVTKEQRKIAWKITQRELRKLFHVAMAHQGR